jgi:hypothetical protein
MAICYLRIGNDSIGAVTRCESIRAACEEFRGIAEGLARFGQEIDASVHIAPTRDEVAEYPDLVLSLGPRGGLRVERA